MRYYDPNFQKFIKNLVRSIIYTWFDVHVSRRENVPKDGPVILAFNHVYIWDPFIIGSNIKNIIYAVSHKEPFWPILRIFQRNFGSIPANTKPKKKRFKKLTDDILLLFAKSDRDLFRQEINHYLLPEDRLGEGKPLLLNLFLEYALNTGGTLLLHLPGKTLPNYERIKRPRKGIAWHALNMYNKYRKDVPIIAGGIVYTKDGKPYIPRLTLPKFKFWNRNYEPRTIQPLLPKHKTGVYVRFGEPITVEDFLIDHRDSKYVVSELTDIINDEISKQVGIICDNL